MRILSLRIMLLVALVLVLTSYNASSQANAEAETVTTRSFTTAAIITIPSSGTATPYPYIIDVSGMSGRVIDVDLTIGGFYHTDVDDVSIMLVSPQNVGVRIMSDSCTNSTFVNKTITFDDEFSPTMRSDVACTGSNYHPSGWGSAVFPSPAPTATADDLYIFDGIVPNGSWYLYIYDVTSGDSGSIDNVTLTLTTSTAANIVQNGNFSDGFNNWGYYEFGNGGAHFINASGQLQMYLNAGPSGYNILQYTNVAMPINRIFQTTFKLGNLSGQRQRMTVIVHDADFTDLRACSFWLPPNAPLQTYQILADTSKAWVNATISFYPSTPNGGNFIIDDVEFRSLPSFAEMGTMRETLCYDTTMYYVRGGTDGSNLLNNGAFSAPIGNGQNTWGAANMLQYQLTGGVLEMRRSGLPAGSILQNVTSASFDADDLNEWDPLEATFQLGNSSNQRQRATLIMHASDFSDLQFCTFWLEPNTALGTYIMRGWVQKDWSSTSFSIYPATDLQWIRVDNVFYNYRPNLTLTGTSCYEPGANVPSEVALVEPFDMDALIPTLLPTATFAPYSPPNSPAELPLIVTPSVSNEASPEEGTFSE